MRGTLEGIRVLDFGRYVAGPYCAAILADFGADVIRIERRGGSEDRTIVPVTDEGEGALFLQINRNKRSVTLDLRRPGATTILTRLVAGADVVVTNLPAPTLPALGLDYESLHAWREDIILANVSSFGPAGPWRERGGFDSVGQAMCGSAFLSGDGEVPVRTPITWVDHAAGLYAAVSVMMALYERQRSGRGQEVQTSLLGAALSFSATYLVEQALTGIDRTAIGNRSFVNGPTDSFATTDGWIVTQVVGDPLFRRWAKLMGEPDWLSDPAFATDDLRGINGARLSERMARWCAERTSNEALDALDAAGIPAGPVLSPRAALDHPQVQAMGLFEQIAYPGLGQDAPLARFPAEFSAAPPEIRTPPPAVGAHNQEVLAELGFSDEAIAAFARDRVI